jgi:hypothetical protein
LLGAAGCVYASKVTGPDGREAFRIHCADHTQCADKAREVCSGNFEVLSDKTEMDGYANNGTGYTAAPNEVVVACRTTAAPSSQAPAPPPSGAPAAGTATPAAGGTCAAAHATVRETAAFWGQLYPEAKRLDEAPSQRDFVEVCRVLPERVQRCLDARYRDAHTKPCTAVLRRLEPGEKNKIDSLFLE